MTVSPSLVSPVRKDVAGKVIDGEAIIMNLTNGAYYSVAGVGAAIWQWIDEEQGMASILTRLTAAYPDSAAAIPSGLDDFVSRLLEEGLVQEGSSGYPSPADPSLQLSASWDTPTLQKYTEMADLLALDPPMPSLGQSGNA